VTMDLEKIGSYRPPAPFACSKKSTRQGIVEHVRKVFRKFLPVFDKIVDEGVLNIQRLYLPVVQRNAHEVKASAKANRLNELSECLRLMIPKVDKYEGRCAVMYWDRDLIIDFEVVTSPESSACAKWRRGTDNGLADLEDSQFGQNIFLLIRQQDMLDSEHRSIQRASNHSEVQGTEATLGGEITVTQ